MTLADAQALSEYQNPEVFLAAVAEKRRRDRLDFIDDVALAVRAASAPKDAFQSWRAELRAARRRAPEDTQPITLFDRLRGERKETLFDRLKRKD